MPLHAIKGLIFDYGGTIDTASVHWSEVLWQGYQHVAVPVSKEQFREAYVHGERTLAKYPLIRPEHNFLDLLRIKVDIEIRYLVDHGWLPNAQWSMFKNAIEQEQSQACLDYAERERFRRSQWSMVKNAIEQEQSQACLGYAERERFRRSQCSMFNAQCSMLNVQCPMVNVQCSMFNVQCSMVNAIARFCYDYVLKVLETSRPVLQRLSERYPMVLVSNFYGNIHTILTDFQLPFFREVIESAVVGVRKPDPRIFKMGVDALGLQPHEVAVIGDSYDKDIVPAKSIGCQTIWFKGIGWNNEQPDGTAADVIIDHFTALEAIFTT